MGETDGLREAVEALAETWDALDRGRSEAAIEGFVADLRDLLAAHPAPEADPTAGERHRCDTCSDTGRVPWMIEGDPNCYQEPDDEGMLPCPDCVPATPNADDAPWDAPDPDDPPPTPEQDPMWGRPATPDADAASEPDAYRVSLDLATGSIDVTPAWTKDASTSAGEGLSEAERVTILAAGFCAYDHLLNREPTLAAVERLVAAREAAAATKARAEAGEQIAQAIEARRVPRLPSNSHDQVVTREAFDFAARIAREVTRHE